MHSSYTLCDGARPEIVRDILGHANIDVTQNVYRKSWREGGMRGQKERSPMFRRVEIGECPDLSPVFPEHRKCRRWGMGRVRFAFLDVHAFDETVSRMVLGHYQIDRGQ